MTDQNHIEENIDLESLAAKHHTIESVWGTPTPKSNHQGKHRRSIQNFVVEVKRSRGNSITPPSEKTRSAQDIANSFFKPKF